MSTYNTDKQPAWWPWPKRWDPAAEWEQYRKLDDPEACDTEPEWCGEWPMPQRTKLDELRATAVSLPRRRAHRPGSSNTGQESALCGWRYAALRLAMFFGPWLLLWGALKGAALLAAWLKARGIL